VGWTARLSLKAAKLPTGWIDWFYNGSGDRTPKGLEISLIALRSDANLRYLYSGVQKPRGASSQPCLIAG
jgi:hypothetical protein